MKPVTFTLHPLSTVAGACLLGAVLFFSSAAFGLGVSDKLIDTIDSDGVALAAVQGLHALVRERDAEIDELRASNDELRASSEALLARVERLEASLTIE